MPNRDSVLLNGGDYPGIISAKHYDSLISELKCPGCAEPLKIPIKLCETGHSICNDCVRKISACPICSKRITNMRPLALEGIVAKVHFTCSNAKHGCTVRLPVDLMKWHKKKCLFNMGQCFMGKVWNACDWTGSDINWIQHCEDNHSDKIFNEHEIFLKTSYERVLYAKEPVIGFFILKIFNEIFHLYQVYDKKHKFMLWTLIHTTKEPYINKRFYYEVELFSPAEISRIMLQRNFCLAEYDNDVLNDGRCISFHLCDLLKFVDSQKVLHYRFRVREIPELKQSVAENSVPLSSKHEENTSMQNGSLSLDEQNLINFPHEHALQADTPNLLKKPEEEDDPLNTPQITNIAKFDQNAVNQKRKMFQQTMMKKNLSLDENDSIDKEIAENSDLKKVMLKEFTIDKNSDEIIIKSPNALPKPPRLSANYSTNNDENGISSTFDQEKISQASS